MRKKEKVEELPVEDGAYIEEIFTPDMARTDRIPIIERPDNREYEKMEKYTEGGI